MGHVWYQSWLPMQAIFRIKQQHKSQLLRYEPADATYHHLEHPHALDIRMCALFLPGPVAMEVLSLHPQGCCLNDASVKDPELSKPPPQSLHELWETYEKQQVSPLLERASVQHMLPATLRHDAASGACMQIVPCTMCQANRFLGGNRSGKPGHV